MATQPGKTTTSKELQDEIKRLEGLLQEKTDRLQEAQETLEAIRSGAVDGLVRSTPQGDQVFLLKGSDQPYRNLIEEMNEGALLFSETGTILYCNDGFARLVDAPLEGIMGSNIRDWVHPNSILIFDVFSSNPVTERRVFETTLKTTKQKPIATLVSVNRISIDSINALALIVTDLTNHMEDEVKRYTVNLEKEITERNRVEAALRESERKYRSLFNSIDEGFCIIEMVFDSAGKPIDYRFLDVNAMFEKQTGLHNSVGKLIRSMVPAHEEYWFKIYGEIALSGEPKRFENEAKALNRYYDVYAFPLGEKRPYRVGVLFKDIAERKKAEKTLKENEQLYHTVFDNSQDGFQLIQLIHDKNGKPIDLNFLKINHSYETIIGVKVNDILNKTARYISPNIEQYWLDIPDRVAKTGISEHVELYNKDINKWLDCLYFRYSPNVVGTLFRDITERKKMEKQLQDAERLAAIGQIAGMVGHDIRNPLQAIIGELYFAKDSIKDAPKEFTKDALESLDFIQEQTDYIGKIVSDLQDYAKALKPEFTSVELCEFISNAVKTILIPDNIQTAFICEKEIPQIKLDKTFTTRILTNLINNAVQAMPKGGKLTLKAVTHGNSAVITVEDTGVGIPEDVKAKMFTPLFTTKSKGQGFGLAVVKRLVEAQGGTIGFESEAGKGTKFTVTLPLTR